MASNAQNNRSSNISAQPGRQIDYIDLTKDQNTVTDNANAQAVRMNEYIDLTVDRNTVTDNANAQPGGMNVYIDLTENQNNATDNVNAQPGNQSLAEDQEGIPDNSINAQATAITDATLERLGQLALPHDSFPPQINSHRRLPVPLPFELQRRSCGCLLRLSRPNIPLARDEYWDRDLPNLRPSSIPRRICAEHRRLTRQRAQQELERALARQQQALLEQAQQQEAQQQQTQLQQAHEQQAQQQQAQLQQAQQQQAQQQEAQQQQAQLQQAQQQQAQPQWVQQQDALLQQAFQQPPQQQPRQRSSNGNEPVRDVASGSQQQQQPEQRKRKGKEPIRGDAVEPEPPAAHLAMDALMSNILFGNGPNRGASLQQPSGQQQGAGQRSSHPSQPGHPAQTSNTDARPGPSNRGSETLNAQAGSSSQQQHHQHQGNGELPRLRMFFPPAKPRQPDTEEIKRLFRTEGPPNPPSFDAQVHAHLLAEFEKNDIPFNVNIPRVPNGTALAIPKAPTGTINRWELSHLEGPKLAFLRPRCRYKGIRLDPWLCRMKDLDRAINGAVIGADRRMFSREHRIKLKRKKAGMEVRQFDVDATLRRIHAMGIQDVRVQGEDNGAEDEVADEDENAGEDVIPEMTEEEDNIRVARPSTQPPAPKTPNRKRDDKGTVTKLKNSKNGATFHRSRPFPTTNRTRTAAKSRKEHEARYGMGPEPESGDDSEYLPSN